VGTVVDIGGQDTKVITVDKRGRAKSFQMNNKCAAGTGRFLDLALNRLGVNFSKLDTFLTDNLQIRLNSLCVVFAESEITGLLAEGRSREEILGGVVTSLADKTTALAARIDLQPPVILTGGLAESQGIAKALSRALGLEVQPTTHGFYAGAIGAAETALHGI
jgi:predicted CoA-substrate-specific enzyme activase